MLGDADSGVRAAAIVAIGAHQQRGCRHAVAAAARRSGSADPGHRCRRAGRQRGPADVDAAEGRWSTSQATRGTRRAGPAAMSPRRSAHIDEPRFRRILIPLLYDDAPEVAHEAMDSVQAAGASDFIFVPTLVSLLRNRQLKGARPRRCSSATGSRWSTRSRISCAIPRKTSGCGGTSRRALAQIPSQKSVDVLVAALEEPDGFLRFKVIAALDRLRRSDAPLDVPARDARAHTLREGAQYLQLPVAPQQPVRAKSLESHDLLSKAIEQKMERTKDRIYRLLALMYPWRDIGAAQWTLAHGEARGRASASEYLDNILTGQLRKRIMPVIEDLPLEENVRRGNVLLKTRPRDLEETLLHLINDDDQVIAAVAIDVVRQNSLVARRRHRARARASRRPRLVCLRDRIVGAGGAADAGGAPP